MFGVIEMTQMHFIDVQWATLSSTSFHQISLDSWNGSVQDLRNPWPSSKPACISNRLWAETLSSTMRHQWKMMHKTVDPDVMNYLQAFVRLFHIFGSISLTVEEDHPLFPTCRIWRDHWCHHGSGKGKPAIYFYLWSDWKMWWLLE